MIKKIKLFRYDDKTKRIVILGSTGGGKSSLGNSLTNTQDFFVGTGADPGTYKTAASIA